MSDEPIQEPAGFPEYETSHGTVINHDQGSYIVRLDDGRVVGFRAATEPSQEQAEADIAAAKAAPMPTPCPQSVTRRQLFLALLPLGLTREAIRTSLGDEAARIEFDEAGEFRRDHPLLVALATNLNLAPAQVDQIFRDASTL